MKLYGLKNCDSCRAAMKALEAAGKPVTFVDIRGGEVSPAQVQDWAEQAGWKTLLNTRSTSYRALSDAQKQDMSAEKAIALMSENPTLIKRPVIESSGRISIGWGAAQKAEYL